MEPGTKQVYSPSTTRPGSFGAGYPVCGLGRAQGHRKPVSGPIASLKREVGAGCTPVLSVISIGYHLVHSRAINIS